MVRGVALMSMALVLACVAVRGDAADPDNVHVFMRAKLEHAQKVLEGLALEDYDSVAKHSQELSLISQAATWQVLQTAEYRQHSTEFRRTADSITEAAKNKNIDGAALAYVELTVRCVNCHKHVRKVKMAAVEPALKKAFAATR